MSARFPGGWCCLSAQPLSSLLPGGIRFFRDPNPPHSTASLAIGLPVTTRQASREGYRVRCKVHDWVRIHLSPGDTHVPVIGISNQSSWSLPFWARPSIILAPSACSTSRGLSMVHMCYPIPASLAPNRLGAGSSRRFSRTLRPLSGGIPFFPSASHDSVTRIACDGRLRNREVPVPLTPYRGAEQYFATLSRRTEIVWVKKKHPVK